MLTIDKLISLCISNCGCLFNSGDSASDITC